jgi:hypothetical protein
VRSGDVDFIVGDSFTIAVSFESAKWSVNRLIDTQGAEYEALLQGVGYSGVDEIYVGIQSWENGIPKGLRVNAFTGYIPENDFDEQPGRYPSSNMLAPCIEENIAYWLNVSPQRIMITMLSGTSYIPFYIGWLDSNATPSQYAYPISVGHSTTSTGQSYTSGSSQAYWNALGGYMKILNSNKWESDSPEIRPLPWSTYLGAVSLCEDGSIAHFPVDMSMDTESEEAMFGQLEGITLPGRANELVTAEDIVIEESTAYVALQGGLTSVGYLALTELKGDI